MNGVSCRHRVAHVVSIALRFVVAVAGMSFLGYKGEVLTGHRLEINTNNPIRIEQAMPLTLPRASNVQTYQRVFLCPPPSRWQLQRVLRICRRIGAHVGILGEIFFSHICTNCAFTLHTFVAATVVLTRIHTKTFRTLPIATGPPLRQAPALWKIGVSMQHSFDDRREPC